MELALAQLKEDLRALIEENTGIPRGSIRDESTIDGDLAMDSFSLLSVQVAIEERFEIECDPVELERLNRFDAIAEQVQVWIRGKEKAPA